MEMSHLVGKKKEEKMEAMTTIWHWKKDSTGTFKWTRISDIAYSLADSKVDELKQKFPGELIKASDKKPTKLRK